MKFEPLLSCVSVLTLSSTATHSKASLNYLKSIGTEKISLEQEEYLFRTKGFVKSATWNIVNLAEKQISVLGMPLQKLVGSKFTSKVEKGSAKLTEHVIK